MKNTVYTVIAVLLLLTTAQFAAGDYTIRNYGDTHVYAIYGYDTTLHGRITTRIRGYYKVESGQQRALYVPSDVNLVYLRIERNNQEIRPSDWRMKTSYTLFYHPHKAHDIYQDWDTISGGFAVVNSSQPIDELERVVFYRYDNNSAFNLGDKTAFYKKHAVLIDGLSINPDSEYQVPDDGGNAFITLGQPDNTCGTTSVEMVLHYYGVDASTRDVWIAGDIHNVLIGTFPGEVKKALNGLGVPAAWYDWGDDPFGRLRSYVDQNRPPCILLRYKASEYHWVVVVGYNKQSDEYLLADSAHGYNGGFRWVSGKVLDEAWGFKTEADSATIWYGGFNPLSSSWIDLGVSFKAQPYTRIVPRSAPTREHFPGMWSDWKSIYVYGRAELGGGKRGWEETVQFSTDFDYYQASSINHVGATGAAILLRSSRVDKNKVKLSGNIEDGALVRGGMSVIVRTFRNAENPWATARVPGKWAVGDGLIIATPLRAPSHLSASPAETSLLPNYPNPFNPETWIPYQLSETAEVTVTLHASDGKLVRTLELGQMPAGAYADKDRAAYWDGQNEQGEPVASGVYFYTLKAGEFSATRKMVIRK